MIDIEGLAEALFEASHDESYPDEPLGMEMARRDARRLVETYVTETALAEVERLQKRIDEADEELANLQSVLKMANANTKRRGDERDALQRRIDDAPHPGSCASERGQGDDDAHKCDCWKSR